MKKDELIQKYKKVKDAALEICGESKDEIIIAVNSLQVHIANQIIKDLEELENQGN
jgi:hypothetical protein